MVQLLTDLPEWKQLWSQVIVSDKVTITHSIEEFDIDRIFMGC